MAEQPTAGQRLAGGIVAFILMIAFFGFVLDKAGVVDLGGALPETQATATSKPKPGEKDTDKPQGRYQVRLRDGANLPGQPITKFTMAYLEKVAGIYGGDLVVSYGTAGRHVPTSFHYSGHAADIGMHDNGSTNDSAVGDRIMRACLIAAGVKPDEATRTAKRGGLIDLQPPGLKVECIWKVDNHHDHVHVAAAPR